MDKVAAATLRCVRNFCAYLWKKVCRAAFVIDEYFWAIQERLDE